MFSHPARIFPKNRHPLWWPQIGPVVLTEDVAKGSSTWKLSNSWETYSLQKSTMDSICLHNEFSQFWQLNPFEHRRPSCWMIQLNLVKWWVPVHKSLHLWFGPNSEFTLELERCESGEPHAARRAALLGCLHGWHSCLCHCPCHSNGHSFQWSSRALWLWASAVYTISSSGTGTVTNHSDDSIYFR